MIQFVNIVSIYINIYIYGWLTRCQEWVQFKNLLHWKGFSKFARLKDKKNLKSLPHLRGAELFTLSCLSVSQHFSTGCRRLGCKLLRTPGVMYELLPSHLALYNLIHNSPRLWQFRLSLFVRFFCVLDSLLQVLIHCMFLCSTSHKIYTTPKKSSFLYPYVNACNSGRPSKSDNEGLSFAFEHRP